MAMPAKVGVVVGGPTFPNCTRASYNWGIPFHCPKYTIKMKIKTRRYSESSSIPKSHPLAWASGAVVGVATYEDQQGFPPLVLSCSCLPLWFCFKPLGWLIQNDYSVQLGNQFSAKFPPRSSLSRVKESIFTFLRGLLMLASILFAFSCT